MPTKFSVFHRTAAIFRKEVQCELRCRYAVGTLLMFSLTTLAAVSMSIGSQALAPEFLAVLLWLILFFSSMAGLARVFLQESETGSIWALRIYADSQPVFFGKFLYNVLLLLVLAIFLLPLFTILLDATIAHPLELALVLLLGSTGLAAAATLIAALTTQARSQASLFTVLSFPIVLPLLLLCIQQTAAALSPGETAAAGSLLFIGGYDLVLAALASVLFDYIWYD